MKWYMKQIIILNGRYEINWRYDPPKFSMGFEPVTSWYRQEALTNWTMKLLVNAFIAQLVSERLTDSIPIKVLNNFQASLHNYKNCVDNCEIIALLDIWSVNWQYAMAKTLTESWVTVGEPLPRITSMTKNAFVTMRYIWRHQRKY